MSLHHGPTDLRDNQFAVKPVVQMTCFTDMLYSSMVPRNLPSQLEILSTGQNYYGTPILSILSSNRQESTTQIWLSYINPHVPADVCTFVS